MSNRITQLSLSFLLLASLSFHISFADVSPQDLINAVKAGDLNTLALLCSQAEDVDGVDETGRTALHYAAELGSVYAIQILLVVGADKTIKSPEQVTYDGRVIHGDYSAVQLANFNGHVRVEELFSYSTDGLESIKYDLQLSCKMPYFNKVTLLLYEFGQKLEKKVSNVLKYLDQCEEQGIKVDFEHFVDHQVEMYRVAITNNKDENKMYHQECREQGIQPNLQAHLAKKVDDARDFQEACLIAYDKYVEFWETCKRLGFKPTFYLFLKDELATYVNAFDNKGFTPLIYASMKGHEQIVRLLFAAGAEVDLRDISKGNASLDDEEQTGKELIAAPPLLWSTRYQHSNVSALLKKFGAPLLKPGGGTFKRMMNQSSTSQKIRDDLAKKAIANAGKGKRGRFKPSKVFRGIRRKSIRK